MVVCTEVLSCGEDSKEKWQIILREWDGLPASAPAELGEARPGCEWLCLGGRWMQTAVGGDFGSEWWWPSVLVPVGAMLAKGVQASDELVSIDSDCVMPQEKSSTSEISWPDVDVDVVLVLSLAAMSS